MLTYDNPYVGTNVVYIITSADSMPTGWSYATDRLSEAITSFSTWKIDVEPLPLFGWYQHFQPWPRLRERVRSIAAPVKLRRAQARACHIDRRRWKRRRFLHALRSKA